jgi:hypothetical protein
MKYPRKRIFATTLSSFVLGGFATFWAIYQTENHFWAKVIGGCLYAIALVIHYFFVHQRDEFGMEGIFRVHKDDDYSDITKQFKKAKYSIEIIVYHGNNLLYYTKSEIIKAIKRDVDVKLLIAEKDSVLLKEAEILEESDGKENQKKAWETLKEIKREANGRTCSIRYFNYNTQARYALIIVDGNWAWWTPYHPGLDVLETSSFVLVDNGKKSIIRECKKHFRTLWINLERAKEKKCAERIEKNE